ncbi:hypothetical protein NE865_05244 [Phthorimaea operculella]|nr:hypothetical protein NE865_05244 [Phthorimaea operculella]
MRALLLCVMCWCCSGTLALVCYNCSTTHETDTACGGAFAPLYRDFNDTANLLVNCSADNAMCFVRSWHARAKYAWIVQRGCYRPVDNDSLVKVVNVPTRAMTCTNRKLREAEYSVCLCHADWCNSSPPPVHSQCFLVFISLIVYFFRF